MENYKDPMDAFREKMKKKGLPPSAKKIAKKHGFEE